MLTAEQPVLVVLLRRHFVSNGLWGRLGDTFVSLLLNREEEKGGNLESLGKKRHTAHVTGRWRAVGRPSERKGAEEGGRSKNDREKAKCVWESSGAEVHCGRADSVSGGSEVWINASYWRRAAAVVREQNIREESKRSGDGKGPDAEFFGERVIFCHWKTISTDRKVPVKNIKQQYPQSLHLHRAKLTRSRLN